MKAACADYSAQVASSWGSLTVIRKGASMKLTRVAVGLAVLGTISLSACKDKEVRTYIEKDLVPYLDSLTHQLCRVRAAAAPTVGDGSDICPPGPDGYKPPPKNGAP
jgi:hypothetical protein